MENPLSNDALLAQMQQQERADKEAARKRWAAMSDEEKQAWQKRAEHMGRKMQSSVG